MANESRIRVLWDSAVVDSNKFKYDKTHRVQYFRKVHPEIQGLEMGKESLLMGFYSVRILPIVRAHILCFQFGSIRFIRRFGGLTVLIFLHWLLKHLKQMLHGNDVSVICKYKP